MHSNAVLPWSPLKGRAGEWREYQGLEYGSSQFSPWYHKVTPSVACQERWAGLRDRTRTKVLALNADDPALVPDILYGLQEPQGMISRHRVKS